MLHQMITTKTLRKLIGIKEIITYGIEWEYEQINQTLDLLLRDFSCDSHVFTNLTKTTINDNIVFKFNKLLDQLILKKVNDNVRRLYKINHTSRDIIIAQLKSLLCERTPFAAIKLDITKFYDSIDRHAILDQISNDSLLSVESKKLMNNFFKNTNVAATKGLPRGIALSATLSELYMRDFDSNVRKIYGIYYYARFVDDIIILTHTDPMKVRQEVINHLPRGLVINKAKSRPIQYMPCTRNFEMPIVKSSKCKRSGTCQDENRTRIIDYLGYRFSYACVDTDKKFANVLGVTISPKKIAKIKTRIVKAFRAFITNANEHLLEQRIQFLTGNYYIHKTSSKRKIKAGIYFNYKQITSLDCLSDLTTFLRKNITASRGKYGTSIQELLTSLKKSQLLRYSFTSGFNNQIIHNFNYSDMRLIKECWK